jgi:two-component system, OmpR family, phosphate regulon response regulator OmpR
MTVTSTKILVLDDDVRLRDLLRRYLSENGFAVQVAETAARLRELVLRERFDLIVLDVMMQPEDGWSVLKHLRQSGDETPVIMLTALNDTHDRIEGLNLGADDYIGKPFSPQELVARIQAVLRRIPEREIANAPSLNDEVISFGEYRLDLGRRTLHKGENLCVMTPGEFGILKILTQNAKKTLSRDRLMELTRGRELGSFDRSLDVQISRLRKVLEQDDLSNPQYVQTVRGVGYVFIPNP